VFWPGFTYLLVFFLFFYPLKLVTGFANVTSFKLKIMTFFLTSTISLNLFMEIILSLTWHIYCHSYYLFISFIPNIHYLLRSYVLFFIIIIIYFYLRGFTIYIRKINIFYNLHYTFLLINSKNILFAYWPGGSTRNPITIQ